MAVILLPLPIWRSSLPDRMIQLVLILSVPQSVKALGECHGCEKISSAPQPNCAMDAPSTWTPETCGDADPANTRCLTFHGIHKGVRDDAERKKDADDRKTKRVELKGCVMTAANEDREKCVKDHLGGLDVKDGECKKGAYSLADLNKFSKCIGKFFQIASIPKEGKYWGVGGNEEYVDITVCLCKGGDCNKEDQAKIDAAPAVKDAPSGGGAGGPGGSGSASLLLESFGFTRILSIAIIVAVAVMSLN